MPDGIKTYVLIGHDHARVDKVYSGRDDVVIIRPEKGKTITQLMEQIRSPANIILQCHGSKGFKFVWNEKGPRTTYAEFFDALPRSGVLSVTLAACYGGDAQAQHMLKHAPSGCLVQSVVGEKMLTLSNTLWLFAKETQGLTKPIDLFLEALDNFNSDRYREFIDEYNKKYPKDPYNNNPDKALPYILGLGGDPGVQINLNDEMALLAGSIDKAALERAVKRVQDRFDTMTVRTQVDENGKKTPLKTVTKQLNASAENKLDQNIAMMAYNLQHGYVPETVEEKRIAFGIIAAYLAESGELQRRIDAMPGYMPLQKRDAYGRNISTAASIPLSFPAEADATKVVRALEMEMFKKLPAAISQTSSHITAMEQGYLQSVQTHLMRDPDVREIVSALRKNFERSLNDDPLTDSLKLQLQAHGVSTKTWER